MCVASALNAMIKPVSLSTKLCLESIRCIHTSVHSFELCAFFLYKYSMPAARLHGELSRRLDANVEDICFLTDALLMDLVTTTIAADNSSSSSYLLS